MKNKFDIYFYIPLIIYIAFVIISIFYIGFTVIEYKAYIIFFTLFVISNTISRNNKFLNVIGFILLILLTVYSYIIGTYEYLNYASFYVSVGLCIYFLFIYILKKMFFKPKKENNNI